jgi:peptidoglycan/xylan/chitin deacetylase (PgdA/CDA1 family)
MRIPGRKTAVQAQRWLKSRLKARAMIIGYHRVVNSASDVFDICVSPENFAQHLEILQRNYHPISLIQMVSGLLTNTLPHKSVAVTFDDGYADNLYNAKPLLERFEVPAAVFVSPGNLGQEFWWDELERMVTSPTTLPESIHLQIGGEAFEWSGGERRQLLNELYNRLLPLKTESRADTINTIKNLLGSLQVEQPEHRALLPAEMIELQNDGLIEIGAHTMTHPILSRLPVSEQEQEIRESKALLENILGKTITGFAYPNGFFTEQTEALVKEMGFNYACSSQRDVIVGSQQIYHLPRFWPKDWNGDRFSRDLKLWLG